MLGTLADGMRDVDSSRSRARGQIRQRLSRSLNLPLVVPNLGSSRNSGERPKRIHQLSECDCRANGGDQHLTLAAPVPAPCPSAARTPGNTNWTNDPDEHELAERVAQRHRLLCAFRLHAVRLVWRCAVRGIRVPRFSPFLEILRRTQIWPQARSSLLSTSQTRSTSRRR